MLKTVTLMTTYRQDIWLIAPGGHSDSGLTRLTRVRLLLVLDTTMESMYRKQWCNITEEEGKEYGGGDGRGRVLLILDIQLAGSWVAGGRAGWRPGIWRYRHSAMTDGPAAGTSYTWITKSSCVADGAGLDATRCWAMVAAAMEEDGWWRRGCARWWR